MHKQDKQTVCTFTLVPLQEISQLNNTWMVHTSAQLTTIGVSSEFQAIIAREEEQHLKYAYYHSCLVSDSTILLSLYHFTHVSSSQHKNMFTTQDHAQEDQRQISNLLYHI